MKKILVAIDGSEKSQKVLIRARFIAEKTAANVMLMTVVKPLRIVDYYTGTDLNEKLESELANSAKRTLEKARDYFTGFPFEIETLLAYGDPAEEILVMAEREKPDLLIMGSRGLGGFGRIMLGSVSAKVLHHINCDMMIIRNE